MGLGGCENTLWVLEFYRCKLFPGIWEALKGPLIVSGDSQLEMSGHLGSKFLHLKVADGSQLNGEQKYAWLSESILRSLGAQTRVKNAD